MNAPTIGRLGFITLFFVVLSNPSPSFSAPPKGEDVYVADLASPKEGVVLSALVKLEKEYPTGTKGFPAMKKLLDDPRPKVRRKAARVLGILHADVSGADLQAISKLLKAGDPDEVIDGLKSLRGLKAASTIPDILPLLNHKNVNIIRDSCRTLAVLGDKKIVPSLEPLLQHPVKAVEKDAQDAIIELKAKS